MMYRLTMKVWDKQIRSLLTYSWSHKKVLAICVICRFWGFQNTKKHLCTMKITASAASKSCKSKTRLHATSIWHQFCYNIAASNSPMSSKLCGYMFVIKVWQCVMILVVKLWKSTHFMHKKCHLWQLLIFLVLYRNWQVYLSYQLRNISKGAYKFNLSSSMVIQRKN